MESVFDVFMGGEPKRHNIHFKNNDLKQVVILLIPMDRD